MNQDHQARAGPNECARLGTGRGEVLGNAGDETDTSDSTPAKSCAPAIVHAASVGTLLDSECFRTEYLVNGVIESGTLLEIFGREGCYKSLIAIDRALRIATGKPFYGRHVSQGPVLYLDAEGGYGFARRVGAWVQSNDVDPYVVPVYRLCGIKLPRAKSRARLEEAILDLEEKFAPPSAVIIDTVAAHFDGDENSSADMVAFVDAIQEGITEFGAAAILIHHTGHGPQDRGRGSRVLSDRCDATFRMERPEHDVAHLVNVKPPRDFPAPPPLTWRIKPCSTEIDGENIESVVADPISGYQPPSRTAINGRQLQMLEILKEAPGLRLPVAQWRQRGIEAGHIGKHRNDFYRIRDQVSEKGLVRIEHGYVIAMEGAS